MAVFVREDVIVCVIVFVVVIVNVGVGVPDEESVGAALTDAVLVRLAVRLGVAVFVIVLELV